MSLVFVSFVRFVVSRRVSCPSCSVVARVEHTPGFEVEAGERSRRDGPRGDSDGQSLREGLGQCTGDMVGGFDFDLQLFHLVVARPHDPEFVDLELANDSLYRRRIDIDASDDHEVVRSADQPAWY